MTQKFIPCSLMNYDEPLIEGHDPKCYRCAVATVVAALGYDVNCQCLLQGKKRCNSPQCGSLSIQWRRALEQAATPHDTAVSDALKNALMRLKTILIEHPDGNTTSHSGDELDNLHIPTGSGVAYLSGPDVQRAADELVGQVHTDPIFHDAAKKLAALELRSGRNLPSVLREWVADLLDGKVSRPATKHRPAGATYERNRMLVELVTMVVDECGLPATSGVRERGESACNAVAQAFQLLGIAGASYETIVKAWKRRKDIESVEVSFRR